MTEPIKLPPEFLSGNSIPVERATITRERMVEILTATIEADRQARGEVAGWQFFSLIDRDWHSTSDPDWHRKCGRKIRAIYTTPQPQQIPEGLSPIKTIEYWRDAYSKPEGDEHFMGHGMVAQLLKEYAQLRAMLEAAPEPKGEV